MCQGVTGKSLPSTMGGGVWGEGSRRQGDPWETGRRKEVLGVGPKLPLVSGLQGREQLHCLSVAASQRLVTALNGEW